MILFSIILISSKLNTELLNSISSNTNENMNSLSNRVQGRKNSFSKRIEKLRNALPDEFQKLKNTVSNGIDKLKDKIPTEILDIKDQVADTTYPEYIIMITKLGCPSCESAKRVLNYLEQSYVELNEDIYSADLKFITKYRNAMYPLLYVKGVLFTGKYTPNDLRKFLNELKESIKNKN